MGWLRLLSEWVGPAGHAVGTDIDEEPMAHARAFAQVESLHNVEVVHDDLFAASMRARLETVADAQALQDGLAEAERELARPGTWGTTFTLIQVWAEKPGG